jgi:hypothetical protein
MIWDFQYMQKIYLLKLITFLNNLFNDYYKFINLIIINN